MKLPIALFFLLLPCAAFGEKIGLRIEEASDLEPLLVEIGSSEVVLLGESTHGTEEFYKWRRLITQRLIEESGFRIVAVEGDWSSILKLNQWIRHERDGDLKSILKSFDRWPKWMWSNQQIYQLANWMRQFNEGKEIGEKAGIYGIDIYGWANSWQQLNADLSMLPVNLQSKVEEVLESLKPFLEDFSLYLQSDWRTQRQIRQAFQAVLEELDALPAISGHDKALFRAVQNFHVLSSAEQHFRHMQSGGALSWNARARHFQETVERLRAFYGESSRALVWAHNTHVGDARATSMGRAGQVNIGQLAREHWGEDEVFILGFSFYQGTVVAGSEWGGDKQIMDVVPAREGSLDYALMQISRGEARLFLFQDDEVRNLISPTRVQRAIGVLFSPQAEFRNYVPTNPTVRYDSLIFIPETTFLLTDI